MLWETIDKDLVLLGMDATNQAEVFQKVGGRLAELGYVKPSYVQALSDRESIFPTGLNLGEINAAIPHTDPVHVNKMGIAIATLKAPVYFREIATTVEEDSWVDVRLIVMLAVCGQHYIETLQQVITVIQDQEVVKDLLEADKPEEVIEIIRKRGGIMKQHYTILSACGTGVATSTVAARACESLLSARGIKSVDIVECKASEIVSKAEMMHPDCIIHTAEIPVQRLGDIKCFRALQLITGIGANQLGDQIADYLKTLS